MNDVEWRLLMLLIFCFGALIGHQRNKGRICEIEKALENQDIMKIKRINWKRPGDMSWFSWILISLFSVLVLAGIVGGIQLIVRLISTGSIV